MTGTKNIYNKQSQECHKNYKTIFIFLYEIHFLLAPFYFNLIQRTLNDTPENKS